MRVCDRHSTRKATEHVHLGHDDAHFDLCAECKTELLSFLCAPAPVSTSDAARKTGEITTGRKSRPKENSAPAE